MTGTKEKLWNFLVKQQRIVLQQKKCIKDGHRKQSQLKRENFLFAIDVLEGLDSILEKVSTQKDRFDTKSLRVFSSFGVVRDKILDYLEGHSVHRINLEREGLDSHFCEVVDTEQAENEKDKGRIKAVLVHGYRHADEVLKVAKVVTYR